MGTDLSKGTTYTQGQQVNADNLNAHVDNATIKYTAISARTLKDPASLSDELLINDGGVLKKITLQQITSLITIPSGVMLDFGGTTEPTGWLFCYGQAISRITYANLFNVIGTGFGTGDGSTTFNVPDCRGRVPAGKDDMGGVSANRLTTPLNGDVLGGTGGSESHALTVAQLASHNHADGGHTHTDVGHTHATSFGGAAFLSVTGGGSQICALGVGNITGVGTANIAQGFASINSTGSGAVHPNVQPTIVFNRIIKI